MSEPLVLGIETSCDETGVGIVRGHTLLADAVASSVEEHARFGGVVPEVASRAHLEAMVPDAGAGLRDRRRAAARGGRHRGDQRARPGRRAAGRGGRGQGARARAGQAAVRRQPPGRPRGRRPARARPAARPVPGPAGQRRPLVAAEGGGRDDHRRAAGRDDRRRRRGGVRQGGPPARAAVPRWPAHRPVGSVGQLGGDRLPARADQSPRPGAAPVRLLVLRAQDRGRALGRGPRAQRRAGAGGRRRRVVPGGRLRRAGPQGARRRGLDRRRRTC